MILEHFPLHHPGLHEDQTRLSNLWRSLCRTQRCSSSVPGLPPSDSYHTHPATRQASQGLQTPKVSARLIAGSGGRRDAQGRQGISLEAHRPRELLEQPRPHPAPCHRAVGVDLRVEPQLALGKMAGAGSARSGFHHGPMGCTPHFPEGRRSSAAHTWAGAPTSLLLQSTSYYKHSSPPP